MPNLIWLPEEDLRTWPPAMWRCFSMKPPSCTAQYPSFTGLNAR